MRRRDPAGAGTGDPATLGERLRAETRSAHLAAERAFDLERRLGSLDGYGDALLTLAAFVDDCAPTLQSLAPALDPALRDGPARRRARLAADLARLGHAAPAPSAPRMTTTPDPDRALGTWYVHEGAALGGLLIAAEVRRRLPAAAPATRFFTGEGRATARRWRRFQSVLAGWAPDDVDAGDRVVAGALATFSALTAAMSGAAG